MGGYEPRAVVIGLISYSLYLAHGPIIVFYRYAQFDSPKTWELVLLVAAAFTVAALMYSFIEIPFRRNAPSQKNTSPQKGFVLVSIGLMGGFVLLGV